MAQSSGPTGSGAFRESLVSAVAQYTLAREANGLSFGFSHDGTETRRRLDFFIGSGSVGRSYLTAIDQFLFQAPVSYYSAPAQWDHSPGFDPAEINLTRPVETGCLRMPVISHFERMTQSACRRGAGEKFWCGTCHDPHRPPPEDKPAYYRSRCLHCHTEKTCAAAASSRAANNDNCVACHMPRAAVQTVRHAAFTDHSIPRLPVEPASPATEAVLIPFDNTPATDRELGLAYASLALRENHRPSGLRALSILERVYEKFPNDAAVATQLAQLYDRRNNPQKACELYARAVAADASSTAAAVNLGGCLAKEGRIEEAINLWRGALRRAIGLEAAHLNLAVALYRSGNIAEAREALEQMLRVNPVSRQARQLLSELNRR